MIEPKIKGNFYDRLFVCIKKSTGSAGLDKLGVDRGSFNLEMWYPYSGFCELLKKAKHLFPDIPAAQPLKLGYMAMYKDERWQTLFKGQDPKDVFGTNKRQDALFMVGRFLIEKADEGLVQVRMTLWSDNDELNDLWAEYYQGVMEGVLALTEKEGSVEMKKEIEGGQTAWIYRILW